MGRSRKTIPAAMRREIIERDGNRCVYCGIRSGQLTFPGPFRAVIHVDHVYPDSRGGDTQPWNLVCSCSRCNMCKSNRTPKEAGLSMDFLPEGWVYDGEIYNPSHFEEPDGVA